MTKNTDSGIPNSGDPITADAGSGLVSKTNSTATTPTTSGRPTFADSGSGRYAIMMATMVAVVLLSGIGGSKGVVFGPWLIGGKEFSIITDGGFFLFPLAYIMGDSITELFGPKAARRAIATGFITNVIAALTYWVIIALPGFTDDYGVAKQQALEVGLGPVWQIVLASMLGFAAGQTTNTMIMWMGKKRRLEKGLVSRLVSSTGVGEAIDTIVFCTVAATAIGITSVGQWANYTFFGFLWKVLVQFALMPLTVKLINYLKRTEPTYGTVTID